MQSTDRSAPRQIYTNQIVRDVTGERALFSKSLMLCPPPTQKTFIAHCFGTEIGLSRSPVRAVDCLGRGGLDHFRVRLPTMLGIVHSDLLLF